VKTSWLLTIALALVASHAHAQSTGGLRAQAFSTRAVFELVVRNSDVLAPGATRILTQSAVATRVRGLSPGNADGLEVQFFTAPMTDAGVADVLQTGGKALKNGDYAALVLFLDKDGKVWQVNLSYVVRGTTVARTVAWKPEELKNYFSNYRMDGTRLVLRSSGTYSEIESATEVLRLSWNVDCDLPVIERR
jgi:hypothetical protein